MKKILIIEDDPLVASIYRNKYISVGFDARIALTGEEGMIQLETFQPDLVQLDLMLPIVDGIEIIKHIRSRPVWKSLPVVVLSNSYLASRVQEAWRAGANKCLAKADCTPKVMLGVIQNLLAPPVPTHSGGTTFLTAAQPYPGQAPSLEADAAFQQEIRDTFQDELPKTVQTLRTLLQRLSKADRAEARGPLLSDLHRKARTLANSAAMIGIAKLAHFAAAFEALAKELQGRTQHVNASTLRTLAQAIDHLANLASTSEMGEPYTPALFKILVVDDEIISRRAVIHSLQRVSLNGLTVQDSLAALALLSENRFDLVFLDVDMPSMSGFELCQKIRDLAAHRETPVVFVTGLTDFHSRAQSALSGGNDLIAKPFLFSELAAKALYFLLRPTA